MYRLTLFFASLGHRLERGWSLQERHSAPGHQPGRAVRRRPPTLEPLEDRLCLSIDLLVSSANDNGVMRYDGTTGAFLGAFVPPGYGNLLNPHGLLIGADGNLLVASPENNRVARFDQMTGEQLPDLVSSGSGGLDRPHGLIFGLDGNLLVSSAETHSIKRYDRTTGAYLGDFVLPYSGGLGRPTGLTFGPDGNLYVMSADDDSVMRFDGTTGAPLPAPGKSGAIFVDPHTLLNAYGELEFGPDGNLYVSNYGGNDVLRIDAATGNSLGEFVPAGDHGLTASHGLIFGPDGNLYVVSNGTNLVLRYDGLTGAFIDVFVPPVHLNGPTYLTFWDTDSNSPIGNGTSQSHRVTASAAHELGLADTAVLVGPAGIAAPPQSGDALGNAALSSAPGPVRAVMPAPAVWAITAGPAAAATASVPIPRSITQAAADLLFGAWPTYNSALEPLAWSGDSPGALLAASMPDGM